MSIRRANTIVSIIVLLALLIQPLAAGAAATGLQSDTATTPTPAPQQPGQGFLFRASVTLAGSRNLARLEKVGVLVLDTFDSNDAQTALVLADGEQLADLARLGFRPQAADELRLLVSAQGPEKAWLVESLQPLLAQADAVVALQAVAGVAGVTAAPDAAAEAVALQALRTSLRMLTPEQIAAVANSSSVDDDADGLTNTQESWWCTDPLDTDTDDDGRTDGAEILALQDWMGNKRAGAPGETPWPSWPFNTTTCPDKDHDSIPNLAERWELGLNMDLESSDRDKFDDGQELFGVTYCPGGDLSCGYGDLPRSSDSGYVGAAMPSWVKAPGKHPVVAAYPIPQIDVVPSSHHVEAVTTVTTDHVITEGTENSYGTATTEGTGSSLSDTTTWNSWQEVSVSKTTPSALASSPESTAGTKSNTSLLRGEAELSATMQNSAAGAASFGLISGSVAATANVQIGDLKPTLDTTLLNSKIDHFLSNLSFDNWFADWFSNNNLDVNLCLVNCGDGFKIDSNRQTELTSIVSVETQDRPMTPNRSGYNVQENYPTQGTHEISYQKIVPAIYPTQLPTITESSTSGSSKGGEHTTTTTQYEEHTTTNTEAFSSQESWGTATAVNSAHAAELWFTFKVRNAGTEYAREIKNLVFNVFIGDDPNPACSYHVGSTACGVPTDTVLFTNFMPGEEHTYTSYRIPLTLNQMRAVDLGEPIRIIVEDFTYGSDELFYQDAADAGVMLAVEDGTEDADEQLDTYLVPTWGTETVLDVLARYFPHNTDAKGMPTAVWTPEIRSDTPAWCIEPNHVGGTLWCKHALSTADWWNVYTDGMGDGSEGFQDAPAAPGQVALFRFNKDSDLDGYSDRSEERLGTDASDAASFPKPELIAGLHSTPSGNQVVSTLSLLNTGLYDAYGVEAVMIAPDDSISITNNTVGGSGRVRAQRQVIVGSRILLQDPLPTAWIQTNHAQPAVGGYYTGPADRTYSFSVTCSLPAGCDVSSGAWSLNWADGLGASGSLNFGAGYNSPTLLAVGAFGLQIGLLSGKVYSGDAFSVDALTPRDTFQYTIASGHESDFTPPVVIVSYNDPQGNHRFVTPINLTSPTDDLSVHAGKMLHAGADVEVVTSEAFDPDAPNTTNLVLQVPATRMVDAHAFLDFIDPDGNVVREEALTQTLDTGPNIVPITWNPANFNPPYDPAKDYIVMAFFTDWQGNILGTAARPLSSFQADPTPAFAMDGASATWNFGSVAQGTILEHAFAFGNTGLRDLKAAVVGTGARADQSIPGKPAWLDTGIDVAVGDAIGVRTGGTVCYGTGGTICYGPDGSGSAASSAFTLPGVSSYSLIGRIGTGTAFLVGSTYVNTAATAGRLYLGTNDETTQYSNNTGTYQTHIEIQGLPNSRGTEPNFGIGPADSGFVTVTLDTYYLPVGSFDRTLTLRTSDADHSSQTLRVQGTVQPYIAPARAVAVSPYRPWDQRVIVAGDKNKRDLVAFNDILLGNPASTQPLWVYNDTRSTQLGSGKLVARATASGNVATVSLAESNSSSLDLKPATEFFPAAQPSALPWWNSGYRYRRQIDILGWMAAGNTVKLNALDFNQLQAAGKVRADKYDLRIVRYVGGGWQEVARNYVTEWEIDFKLLNDISGTTDSSYWLYYGNPNASMPPTFTGASQGWWVDMYHDKWCSEYGGTWTFNQTMDFGSVCDPPLDHDSRIGSSFDESDKFRGRLFIPSTGTWTFRLYTNDGYRLHLDDVEIGHYDGYDGNRLVTVGSMYLKAGWYKMEIRNMWVNCGAWKFYMEGPGFGNQIVPASHFALLWENVASVSVSAEVAQYGTIRGTVFSDNNNNGVMDSGEAGLGGVAVNLSSVGTTTTATDGTYAFFEVSPNTYTLSATTPNGYVNTTPGTVTVSLDPGATVVSNFGMLPRASVSGKVFHDTDNDGSQDTGEAGVAGVSVTLSTGTTLTTASDGSYTFADLMPGSYSVSLSVPDGYVNTTATTIPVTLTAGQIGAAHFGILIYTIEKVSGSDHANRFFLPESFRSGRRYWVQYGRSLTYSASGSLTAQVEAPQVHYGSAELDVFVTSPASSNIFLQIGLDVGCDSSQEWSINGNYAVPITFPVTGLAVGFNRYLAALPPDPDGSVAIPLCTSLNLAGQLYLTDLVLTPDGISDVSVAASDIALNPTNPVEGDEVTVQAVVHNASQFASGALTASFYATSADWGEWYIGSAFVPNVPAGGTTQAEILWNTLGFTGTVPVRVVVDPYNRLAETNKANNEATASLTIKTRPDLHVAAIVLSDTEPVVGQVVTATLALHNNGQTGAGAFAIDLYDGNPASGGMLVQTLNMAALAGGASSNLLASWTPAAPGEHRLFVEVDSGRAVSEYAEDNNETWDDVYVGLAGPILIDSGGGDAYDPAYTAENGFGYLDGETSTFCGDEPDKTQRSDYDAEVQYRFDHLLPGHFYHLDVTLFECDGTGRQEKISVDDNVIEPLIDLADGAVHRLSYLLDPAFYADRSVLISIAEIYGNDVVVSEVNLYDVDYRYSDAGGGNDPAYSAATGYGWLDGVAQTSWGTLPYQSRRTDTPDSNPDDDPDNELRYRYDRLDPARRYQLHATVYQGAGTGTVIESIAVDDVDTGTTITVVGVQRRDVTLTIPPGTYASDRSIVVRIIRTNASANAFVNLIALEELTLSQGGDETQNLTLHTTSPNWISFNIKPPVRPALYCSGVTATSAFTTLAGDALLVGAAAPVNSIVEAYTPDGVKVGCYKVTTAGKYGYMRVYGAEGATPGMTPGEPIQLKINGIAAQPSPYPVIWQNDKLTRDVDLAAADVIPVETFLDPIASQVVKLQSEIGTYLPPPADPRFNTTTTVAPGWGYLLYTNATASLAVTGDRVPANTPLALHAGWNWLGYLPTCELPVATALAGIASQYDLLHNEIGTYRPPPADPAYNTFNTMAPGKGYMIHMTAAATLTYPATGCGAAAGTEPVAESLGAMPACPAVATGVFTHYYGTAMTRDRPLPAGAVILAYSPRGEVVGCAQVGEAGLYPYLRVYGADGDLPGMRRGERVFFAARDADELFMTVSSAWIEDYDVHRLDLAPSANHVYLAIIVR